MRSLFLSITCLFLIFSCVENSSSASIPKVFSHEFIKVRNSSDFDIIDLDSITNYSELLKKMNLLNCEDKIAGIQFKWENTQYHLIGISGCPALGEIACYFNRNHLYIKNDSIYSGFGIERTQQPIEDLHLVLESIMETPYKYRYDSHKLNQALISFHVTDDQPVTTISRTLKEIVSEFYRINSTKGADFFEYDVLFEDHDVSLLPPPPPPPLQGNEDI